MLVHPRRRPREQVQVPLTSLIDMVFLLLIYFLLTTNFMVEEGIDIKLPKAKAATPRSEEVLTVNVDRKGHIFIDGMELAENVLLDRLREMLGKRADKLVVVKADRDVVLDKAVKVLDLAKAAGAERLSLATEKDF
jgi:biopolymer transport protein ExbD